MAFTVAPQLDPARLADGEFASASAAAQFIAETCLVDGPVGQVGLEIEAHCYDPADPHRRPSWNEIIDGARPGNGCGASSTRRAAGPS